MEPQELDAALTPRQARAAELLAQVWDGAVLTPAEQAELRALASHPEVGSEFQRELETAHAVLQHAYAQAVPSPGFSAKVMQSIETLPKPVPAAPTVTVYASARTRSSWGGWKTFGMASAAAVLAAVCVYFISKEPAELPAQSVVLARGGLNDEQGRAVTRVEPGRLYQVSSEKGAVLKSGATGLIRAQKNSALKTLALARPDKKSAGQSGGGVWLEHGSLYAHQPGPEPLVVQSRSFQAEVAGTSLVMLDEVRMDSSVPGIQSAPGLVLVFQGSARVRLPLNPDPVALGAGDVYVAGAGLDPETALNFIAQAGERVEKLNSEERDPNNQPVVKRKRYQRAVEEYQTQVRELELRAHDETDGTRRAELLDRRERIVKYLDAHRRGLEGLSGPPSDTPGLKALRIQRAREAIEKGQLNFSSPSGWM